MSALLGNWASQENPAALFLALWDYLNERVARQDLTAASRPSKEVAESFEAALETSDARMATERLVLAVERWWIEKLDSVGKKTRAGLVLGAMHALDDAFLEIHPRTLMGLSAASSGTIRPWLTKLKSKRIEHGFYAELKACVLVPRGPFARHARGRLESATFSLVDQFGSCAVAPRTITEDGRRIILSPKVIDQGAARGVAPRPDRRGSEAISLAPLAESHGDLVTSVTREDGRTFIDVEKGPSFHPSALFSSIIRECQDSDVVVFPELVIGGDDKTILADVLSTMSGTARPRMVVGGSGLEPNGSEWPHNVSSILNGAGHALWEHRKVAAYGMLKDTFGNLNIPDISGADQLMEKISWSDSVTIGDVEGFGRCVVLICQDLMMKSLEELLRCYEPDWLFIPILDSGTSFARWPFKRVVDLSAIGPTRFVVVSSLTMQHWRKKHYSGEQIGVAVGPRHINSRDNGTDRPSVAQEINCESPKKRHGTTRWRHGDWKEVVGPSAS